MDLPKRDEHIDFLALFCEKLFFDDLAEPGNDKCNSGESKLIDSAVKNGYDTSMSRPREFDVDRALRQSMEVFWTKGFKATSYDDLTSTTQVKKQSLYCVFKNKRELFLRALVLYREQSIAMLEALASQEGSPVKKLEAICEATLCQNDETMSRGCLIVNSALEFGTDDEEVNREVALMFNQVGRVLETVIRSGQEQQLITSRLTSKALALHLNNALSGAKIMEKSGAPREQIAVVLRTALALMMAENDGSL